MIFRIWMRDFRDQERYCWSLLRDLEPTWVLIHLYKLRGAHEAWGREKCESEE